MSTLGEVFLRVVDDVVCRPRRQVPAGVRAGGYPNLAEHVEQHITASGDGESESEFEFGLGLILDGLKKARGMS